MKPSQWPPVSRMSCLVIVESCCGTGAGTITGGLLAKQAERKQSANVNQRMLVFMGFIQAAPTGLAPLSAANPDRADAKIERKGVGIRRREKCRIGEPPFDTNPIERKRFSLIPGKGVCATQRLITASAPARGRAAARRGGGRRSTDRFLARWSSSRRAPPPGSTPSS